MNNSGLSRARLGRMHDVMAGYVERGEVPGIVTLVSRSGETHVDAIGMPRDAILDEPVDRLLPELAGRRVLKSPEGPLEDTAPVTRPITLRDLLTFRMGFGQMIAPPDAYPILKAGHELKIGMGPPNPAAMPAPDEWMRRLGSLPLMHQPGDKCMD